VGDTVAVGAAIARVEAGGAAAARPQAAPAATPVNPAGPGENIEVGEDEGSNLTLSPAVRRIVLEHHLDPSKIHGTGKDGRLTKDDVMAAVKTKDAAPPPPPAPAPAAAPPPPPPPARPAAPGERHEERVRM